MTSKEIREQFLNFFREKGHEIVASSPVVPYEDPTLLFINAGMNQFKDVFLGKGTREYSRASDTQKCIRVSGKHNDLEEVGMDTYHHTFFEMLGNWSFGDYYKKEAIEWAWELLTEVWKLPKERLWVTVYKSDTEALNLWMKNTDIDDSHILEFGEKENFWEMGDTGPCGPCSEIHICLGDDLNNPALVNSGSPECIEIWNLVFMQYNRDSDGALHDLPKKHVDTGMGFERICAVLQGKKSNYDTDIFSPLIAEIERISGEKYSGTKNQKAMRVIADHIRTLSFAIADGATPSNEGRGYVLRRILRRASRYGRQIGLKDPFLFRLAVVLSSQMGEVFPELRKNIKNIETVIKGEEKSFNATLDRGLELFEDLAAKAESSGRKTLTGSEVFKLYDTFGFPLDLTNVLATEKNLNLDEAGFKRLMSEQKNRARIHTKNKILKANIHIEDLSGFDLAAKNPKIFAGYDRLETESVITGIKNEGGSSYIILDETPFYAESGGQSSDKGSLEIEGNLYEVRELVKIQGYTVHVIDSYSDLKCGDNVRARVNRMHRLDTARNHSATHLLHRALRIILGNHVGQAGSFVSSERMRFDFTHFEKVSEEDILKAESIVNEKIREAIPLEHLRDVPFDQAKKMGALMFFGDKYSSRVNIVKFGNFSMEFCGGTHVENSSVIGMFKILSESSVSSGVRRIEAITGRALEDYIRDQEELLKEKDGLISDLKNQKKELEERLSAYELKEKLGALDGILKSPSDIKGVNLFSGSIEARDINELKSIGDDLRNRMKSGVGILFSDYEGKVSMLCVVTDDLIKSLNLSAGKIVGAIAKSVGGGGGGRPHMATAGIKDSSKILEASRNAPAILETFL